MGFMGILVLAWAFMFVFIAAICVFLFVFIPCLIIFIINLVKAIKNKWPKGNTVAVIITGVVLSIIIALTLALAIFISIASTGSGEVDATSSEAAISLLYLIPQI